MILDSFDQFTEVMEEEMRDLPDYVYKELNGGVLADKNVYLHPGRLADDLYILGTYSSSHIMGKQIILYYGSFVRTMRYASDEAVRRQIRETLRHEFRHHLETRAGLFGQGTLIEEDDKRMRKYYMMHAPHSTDSLNSGTHLQQPDSDTQMQKSDTDQPSQHSDPVIHMQQSDEIPVIEKYDSSIKNKEKLPKKETKNAENGNNSSKSAVSKSKNTKKKSDVNNSNPEQNFLQQQDEELKFPDFPSFPSFPDAPE